MFKKKITIIICSYNNSLYLKKCLESIFNQSLSQNYYNVILVDDKSEDNSLEITKQYQDKKNFTIIKNYKNIGLVKSCNKAIKIAKTKFIVRVDSDDYISKKFVATFLESIDEKYDFIFSNYKILKKNKVINVEIANFKNLISCSVAMNRNILIKIGGYKNFLWEEYDLYLRYLKKTKKIFKINKYLYFYRYHQSNMTKLKSWKIKAWKELHKTHTKSTLQKLDDKIILSSK